MTEKTIVDCPGCGQKNRVPVLAGATRFRCGRCRREFAQDEITVAAMQAAIAETFGGTGVTGVRFADEDGTVRGGFDFPKKGGGQ